MPVKLRLKLRCGQAGHRNHAYVLNAALKKATQGSDSLKAVCSRLEVQQPQGAPSRS